MSAALFARILLVPVLRRLPRGPILELGAGTGETLLALRRFGFDARGVDGSASQVEEAAQRGAVVEQLDGAAALERCASASLAAIIALDVLEHLETDVLLRWLQLAEAKLVDGGALVLRGPNGSGLFGGVILHGDITHRRAFTCESLRQLAQLSGLRLERVGPCRPLIHGPVSALRALAWRGVEVALSIASAAESGSLRGPFTRNLMAVLVARPGPEGRP